jgi:hypothetical protein
MKTPLNAIDGFRPEICKGCAADSAGQGEFVESHTDFHRETPMPYLLLIHEPVGQRQTRTRAEGEAVYDRMLRFADEL